MVKINKEGSTHKTDSSFSPLEQEKANQSHPSTPLLTKTQQTASKSFKTLDKSHTLPRASLSKRAWTWIKTSALKFFSFIGQAFKRLFSFKNKKLPPISTNDHPKPIGEDSKSSNPKEQETKKPIAKKDENSSATLALNETQAKANSERPVGCDNKNQVSDANTAEKKLEELITILREIQNETASIKVENYDAMIQLEMIFEKISLNIDKAIQAQNECSKERPEMASNIQGIIENLQAEQAQLKTRIDPKINEELITLAFHLIDELEKQKNTIDRKPQEIQTINELINQTLKRLEFFKEFDVSKHTAEDLLEQLKDPIKLINEKKQAYAPKPAGVTGCGFVNIKNSCYINAGLQLLLGDHFLEETLNDIPDSVATDSPYKDVILSLKLVIEKAKTNDQSQLKNALEKLRESLFTSGIDPNFIEESPWGITRQHDGAILISSILQHTLGFNIQWQQERKIKLGNEIKVLLGVPDPKQLIEIHMIDTIKTFQGLLDNDFGTVVHTDDKENAYRPVIDNIQRTFTNFDERALLKGEPKKHLFFQILRFNVEYDRALNRVITKKNNTSITFPDNFTVNMKEAFEETRNQENPLNYRVIAFEIHQGNTPDSGHYFTYRLDEDGKWRCYDDSKVTEVSKETALQELGNAYNLHLVKA